jgi:hypothetical protein
MGKPGRKKKVIYTRIAIEIACGIEHCGRCKFLNEPDRICRFFKRELSLDVVDFEPVVERCSSCLMAERVAHGECTD